MRAIKALVVTMGVLIAGGVVLLGYGLFSKARQAPDNAPPTLTSTTGRPVTGEFGAVEIRLPPGARVEQMEAVAGRLILRLADVGGDRILVIDPLTGRVTGSIALTPTAP